MPWIEIALPGTLLLAKFLLKLVVDRSATLPDIISAILALPVDIVFLSASLLAGYAISSSTNVKSGLILFTTCLCLSILIVVIWRRSESQFERDHYWRTGALGLVNIAISGSTLVFALNLLSSEAQT
jgi:hypothetical protein